jgi:hypothetical protein
MPNKFADRVKETSTTTGTGDVTLGGAVAQFESFSGNYVVGEPFFYAIVGQSGTEWEVGIGTLSGGSTLVRTSVLQSSNADALVSFSGGTKDVFVSWAGLQANRAVTRGKAIALGAGIAFT